MPSGFLALLDDIAVLAKAAATSLDDVALGAGKSASKTAAVVIDDMAVSPQYVQGLSPKRELPVVWKITLGSLRNKFLIIIPIAMLLSWLAPQVLPFLLIAGGSYLVYEGAEKLLGWMGLVKHHAEDKVIVSGEALEKVMVSSAVRTDLILSTEIMLIALSSVHEDNWIKKLLMLFVIAVVMTLIVYGAVGLLVKLDDIGLHMANRKISGVRLFGVGIIKTMPWIFKTLTVVGTLAMLWVGGHLVWKSLGDIGVAFFADSLHMVEDFFHSYPAMVAWFGDTAASIVFGLTLGVVFFYAIHHIAVILKSRKLEKVDHELKEI